MNRITSGALGVIAVAAVFAAAALPGYGEPAPAGALQQPPAAYRLTVGDAQVTVFSDCTMPIDVHRALSDIAPAEIDALLAANFQTNPMDTSLNVFLIQRAGRTILVDTGFGDPKWGGCGRLFDAMASVGVRPDQVDDILMTHLHLDHIGGLLRNGAMTFPKATLHVSKPELDAALRPSSGQDSRARQVSAFVMSSLKPYLDAGRVKTFDQSGDVVPGVSAKIIPGHTVGSALYTLTSGGQDLVFIGDYNPVPVVGFRHPEAAFVTDQDRVKASASRQQVLGELARSGALVAAPHLDFPGVGHVGVEGSGYRWFPIVYANRDPNVPTVKF